ncbi:nucleotide exchange factor GrpE [Bacillus salipaludis]|uniref:Protein GrpE n=2 Tax=Bacillus salipaludis TaxID=2547811 RepID=A0AA90TTM6_9BACI|nr:nucleotide exchange factor GrpE [Bacillus salipaludis]MDQ6599715.1 nucleotide exchange factor GrpE [Bacillus salipaludis]
MTNENQNTINEEMAEQTQEANQKVELTEENTAETVFAEEGTTGESTVQDLLKEIEGLKSKLDEADNRYLRLQADFDNFRRRSRLDQEASEKYRAQKLITDLLPALDNFERAMKVEVDNEQAKSLLQGMDMIYRGIVDALKKEGVEPIETVEKEFNPHLHQAVMQESNENYGSNIIIEEFQKGYLLKDRVIRASMVKVNQ